MCPNVNYNQGSEYFCDNLMIDLDYDSEACSDEYKYCRQCVHCCKQDYTIVVQNPDQKHLINPQRK